MSAEPKNAPTQGVQPIEKTMPKRTAEGNPSVLSVRDELTPLTEQDDESSADDIQCSAIVQKEGPNRSCQRTHAHEDHREAQHEPECVLQNSPRALLLACGEVGHIDGDHGQQARGDEGDHAFQERDQELHSITAVRDTRQSSLVRLGVSSS